MSILSPDLLGALKSGSAELELVAEIELDGGTVTFSQTKEHGTPILEVDASLLHKLQPAFGKSNLAKVTIDLIDRARWGDMVAYEYLKNRRFNLKIGRRGAASGAFYTIFTGLVTDFGIAKETLTIEAQDDLYVAKDKVPEENETKTQSIAFQNQNPFDIKTALLETYGEIPSARLNSTEIEAERDRWYIGWFFDRVLTSPVAIKTLINELDEQTLSVTFTDGDKITMRAFAPPVPGQSLLEVTDEWLRGSLAVAAKMEENFVNHCTIYYDWDESGSEGEEHFDSIVIVSDADSQSASEWDETARKEIKSKWIRSYTIGQPSDVTGTVVYHCNKQNGAGNGTLRWYQSTEEMSWQAPGDTEGAKVKVDKDGKFQLYSGTTSKYIRVVVTQASLPGSNQTESLAVANLPGLELATILGTHWVARYRDPRAELRFNMDLAAAIHLDQFIRVSDVLKITSDRIITKGQPRWNQERLFLTSARPDFKGKRVKYTGIQTTFKKRYGFIAPSSMTNDYDAASEAEREYAFIADAGGTVGTDGDPGYYIW